MESHWKDKVRKLVTWLCGSELQCRGRLAHLATAWDSSEERRMRELVKVCSQKGWTPRPLSTPWRPADSWTITSSGNITKTTTTANSSFLKKLKEAFGRNKAAMKERLPSSWEHFLNISPKARPASSPRLKNPIQLFSLACSKRAQKCLALVIRNRLFNALTVSQAQQRNTIWVFLGNNPTKRNEDGSPFLL